MGKSIEALKKEWEFIRSCSTSFINELSDGDLDRKLPREGLDTLRKHFEEMFEVQNDYVDAINSSVMEFNSPADTDIEGKLTKQELLDNMQKVDEKLFAVLEKANENGQVVWFGEKEHLAYHIAAMIAHEALHIGQIIAYCYALNIDIPEFIVESWALSGR
ncbi:MAG: hypothetical protein K0R84_16 [Clostridia bacterium]|jgi:uncharacterized damage-inducible protein DinB|nr:hypothetical protein [Clostridia bacterium]